MYRDSLNIVDGRIYAYLLIDYLTSEILDGNKLARTFYSTPNGYPPLERLFTSTSDGESISSILKTIPISASSILTNVTSIKADGTSFLCNIELCKVDDSILFLVVKENSEVKDLQITEIVEITDNPIFRLEHDNRFTTTYGNTRYYQCTRMKKEIGSDEKDNSFLALLEADQQLAFSQKVEQQLERQGECDINLELHIDSEYVSLYRFNAFQSIIDKKLYGVLISVKKQSELLKKIEYDQQYFEVMQKYSKDLLFRIDVKKRTLVHRGDISMLVDLLPEMTGFPESVRKTRLVHPDDLEGYIAFSYLLMNGTEASFEPRFQFTNGTFEKYRLQGTPMYDSEGNTVQVVGKCENIQKFVEIETRANFDSLTTTMNKQSFKELVENYLQRAVSSDKFALLFLDLDDFKRVNDTLGHVFGDFLLEALAKRILNCIRSRDRVGRVGGDEFVIFFQFAPNRETVQERAEAILHSLRREFTYGEERCKIKASIGISLYPEHGDTFDKLYHIADKALYQSKAKGKDVATVWDGYE